MARFGAIRAGDDAMFLTRSQSDDDDGPGIDPAIVAYARRAMLILCIVYLGLGVFESGRFFFGQFQDLVDARTAAAALLEQGLGDPTEPADQLVAAADGATGGVTGGRSPAQRSLDTAKAAVRRGWMRMGGFAAAMITISYFLAVLLFSRRRLLTRGQVVQAVTFMVLLVGAVLLASRLALQKAIPDASAGGLLDLVVLHVAACLIMPMTSKECTQPFGALLLVWAATLLVPGPSRWEILDRVVGVIISPVVLIPGALIAGARTRRRRDDATRQRLEGRMEQYDSELLRARIVHDAMFPPPFTGNISFEYEYQPIHEIGGDYVHTYIDPGSGRVLITLLDVAGHGLAAALTVNRLFGELERILAENAKADPDEITTLLNRYIYLTMAPHSLYATGTCMMLDPADGCLTWANAGHPPSMIRHGDGSVSELPTTSMMLGVLEPDEFSPSSRKTMLHPGEVVIAYTDGAFEARDAAGQRFGLDRLRETAKFDPPPRSWPKFIAGAVAQHHDGYADDDVLIAAITLRSRRISESLEESADRLVAVHPSSG